MTMGGPGKQHIDTDCLAYWLFDSTHRFARAWVLRLLAQGHNGEDKRDHGGDPTCGPVPGQVRQHRASNKITIFLLSEAVSRFYDSLLLTSLGILHFLFSIWPLNQGLDLGSYNLVTMSGYNISQEHKKLAYIRYRLRTGGRLLVFSRKRWVDPAELVEFQGYLLGDDCDSAFAVSEPHYTLLHRPDIVEAITMPFLLILFPSHFI